MRTFDDICGVAVSYDRLDQASYGTRGVPRKHLGPVNELFYQALVAWMTELGQVCPWGLPELLVTGGVTGDPHGPPSRHTQGRAIDIDALFWKDRPPLVTREALDYPIAYLAVECILRRHFGTVLDYWYDGRHQDHWHVDDGHPVEWRQSPAFIVFLQACLRHVWNETGVVVDGICGKLTTEAWLRSATLLVPEDPAKSPNAWRAWLLVTAQRAWEQIAALS